MDQNARAEELRNVARFVEATALPALASYAKLPLALHGAGLREFPRPSREDQAAEEGFAVLRKATEQAVAGLYALALALERGLEVPPTLWATVQPFVEAYRAAGGDGDQSPRSD